MRQYLFGHFQFFPMHRVIIKAGKEEPIQRFHPWIFSGAIASKEDSPSDGDIVEVFSSKGEYLASGHYHDGSIAVRIFSFQQTKVDVDFWKQGIKKALEYRQNIGLIDQVHTNCYRLIHAEGDGLPGLIVDIYGKIAVLQCHSIGMHRVKDLLVEALQSCFGGELMAVYDKSKETLAPHYANGIENGYLCGSADPQFVLENGHQFFVDWISGQKTGFFLDQRINREMLTQFAKDKSVLNAFSYSGGFSVYALKAGASIVHSVDASWKAIEWCEQNVAANSQFDILKHKSVCQDVLQYLKTCEQYDVVIVDPPAFAKSFAKRHNAVQGYKRLNVAALKKVAPGGLLFTFSCSQVVDRELFYNTIVAAAIEAGRNVRVMYHLSQSPDHPVSLFHAEGSYLKGLLLYVE